MPWEDLCRITLKKSIMASSPWLARRFTHTHLWPAGLLVRRDQLRPAGFLVRRDHLRPAGPLIRRDNLWSAGQLFRRDHLQLADFVIRRKAAAASSVSGG